MADRDDPYSGLGGFPGSGSREQIVSQKKRKHQHSAGQPQDVPISGTPGSMQFNNTINSGLLILLEDI